MFRHPSIAARTASFVALFVAVSNFGLGLHSGAAQEYGVWPTTGEAPRYDLQVIPTAAVTAAVQPADSPSTGPTAATVALSEAEVERIVAAYLAKREAEAATRPMEADMLPPPNIPVPHFDSPGYVVGSDKKMSASWNHGLELESANKDFKVHIGGRTQFDTSFFSNDNHLEQPVARGGIGELQDSMQFRRARLRVDGTMYETVEFAAEYEFLNQNFVDFTQTPAVGTTVPAPTDLWVNFTHLPVLGSVKVGNQKPPIGFEHLESSRFLNFIERSFNQDLFYGPFNNGFSPGISATNTLFDKTATWTAGAYASNANGNTNIFGYGLGNDYMYVFRGTMIPFIEQDGRYLVHLGASYEIRAADDGRVRVRTRGNLRNGPPGPFNAVYADTTSLLAEDQHLLNLECVYQNGPLLIQSEYCISTIFDATNVQGIAPAGNRNDVVVHGGYIEVLYFLTGEHRAYSRERGTFDRVVPHGNAFRVLDRNGRLCEGSGAWQVGIRYDHADLNDTGVNGGILDAVTLGLNWFLNPNMKIQTNLDWTHRSAVSRFVPATGAVNNVAAGDVFGLGTRLAIDF